jgi:hypothetical protein
MVVRAFLARFGTNLIETEIPKNFTLHQNYPNPFNSKTVISYEIPKESNVTIKVFDELGREVEMLVKEKKPAGNYELNIDGSNLSSGVYLYRIQAGDYVDVKKMILMK